MAEIRIDATELKPVIEAVVCELMERLRVDDLRIAYSESEAAEMLGIAQTTLAEERKAGRIECSKCGRQYRFTRQNIVDYLTLCRVEL